MEGARWHFVGPLQRNKVKYVVGVAELIHSVDSPALLDEIAYFKGHDEEEEEAEMREPKHLMVHIHHGPSFFNSFRDLTASGFWSSKMGIADLGYTGNTFVAEWTGGAPREVLARLGVEED